MFVLTLGRQACVNPVLLAFSIVAHVRVAQRRQFTGGVFGSVSGRAGAIDHDVRSFVRQQSRCKLLQFIGG